MKKLIIILLLFTAHAKAQTNAGDFINRLGRLLNPARDSIQKARLKAIKETRVFDKMPVVIDETRYDTDGNLVYLSYDQQSMTLDYNASGRIQNITCSKPEASGKNSKTSMVLDRDVDTLAAIELIRSCMPHLIPLKYPHPRPPGYRNYDETVLLNNSTIISQHFITQDKNFTKINSLLRPNASFNQPGIAESYLYQFVNDVPLISYIHHDTINKIRKTFLYWPRFFKNEPVILKSYSLYSVVTEVTYPDHSEVITDDYNDGYEKIYRKVQSKEITKYYQDASESKTYQRAFFNHKKLVNIISLKREYVYY